MKRIYEAHVESTRSGGHARRFVALSDGEAMRKAIGGLAPGQSVALWRDGRLLGRLSAPVARITLAEDHASLSAA